MIKLKGCYSAVITPFNKGKLDLSSFRKLLEFQTKSSITGIVAAGSTGEGASLKDEEYYTLLEKAVEFAGDSKEIIAGFGSNCTEKTIGMLKRVERTGVKALLVIAPYYNKPTQAGLFKHFAQVAENTRLPVIVYNIPGRTGVNIAPSTIADLRKKYSNIVAVKEASGSLDQVSEIINLTDEGFTVLSGDDSLTLPMMSVGARGVISVASNIIPDEISSICSSFLKADTEEAMSLHQKYFPFIKALFTETNPIPIKYVMSLNGFCSNELRLPLTEITKDGAEKVKKAMVKSGII
ncbi:MAG: 4-hydroxy-tetrahydrodipicolinate synthase [Elusimicrobiota bacterium]